jgi:putative tryptophan/tyrosine transport system substrate-binding protein
MGVRLLHFEARGPVEIDAAFAAMMPEHAQAVIIAPDPFFRQQGRQLAELAERHRLPSMLATRACRSGRYGQDYVEHYRRASTYVDNILNGTNSADLLFSAHWRLARG